MIELLAAVAFTMPLALPDTTLAVPPGSVIMLIAESGDLVVDGGVGDRAELSGPGLGSLRVTTKSEPGVFTIRLRGNAPKGQPVRLRLPARNMMWVTLASGSVAVAGRRAGTTINTIGANIIATDHRGPFDAHTVNGTIDLSNAVGGVKLRSTASRVTATAVRGSIEATSSSGELRLSDFSGPLKASTYTGSMLIEGDPSGVRWEITTDLGEVVLQVHDYSRHALEIIAPLGRLPAVTLSRRESDGALVSQGTAGGGRVVVRAPQGSVLLRPRP